MDTLSFGFVLLIIVLGGLTAYIADFLGRFLGKKRLSIFGLRPKHTAILITSFAGLLIPLVTMLLLITLSHEVKVWLVEGQSAVEERNRKVTELKLVNARVSQKTQEAIQLEHQKSLALQNMQEAQSKLTTFKNAVKELQSQSKALKQEVARFRKDLLAMHQRYQSLETTHQHLQIASKGLKNENLQLSLIQSNLEKELKGKAALSSELESKMTELQGRVNNLNVQKKEILAQYDHLSQQFQQDIQQAKLELESARSEKEKAEIEIQHLHNVRLSLETGLNTNVYNSRLIPIIFQEGEELARVKLEPNQTEEQVRKAIVELLERTHKVAKQKGASPAGRYQTAAGFADLPLANGILSSEEQKEAIVQTTKQIPENTVLTAHAFWNSYKGEYIILKIISQKDPLIYKKGALLASTTINGARTAEHIFEQITRFINEKIRPKVQKEKMIPFRLPQPQYIEVPYSQMWSLIKRIKDRDEKVQLNAYIAADTRAADMIKLDFTIQ